MTEDTRTVSTDTPQRWVLLGPPGAGKGTQAALLAEQLGLAHVESGGLLRDHRARDTDLGREAATYMTRGLLVPDELVIEMVLQRMAQDDAASGAVLDGFPRTHAQAEALDGALAPHGVTGALSIAVSEAELVRRIGSRLTCRQCQAPYPMAEAPPQCSRCGGELAQRDDERPEAVRQRLQEYRTKTASLLDYYGAQGRLAEVDGEQQVAEVTRDLLRLVRERAALHDCQPSGTIRGSI